MKKNSSALFTKLDNRSIYLRSLVVDCLFGGGRGHMGSAMSLIEILRVLYDNFLIFNPKKPNLKKRDQIYLKARKYFEFVNLIHPKSIVEN